MRWELARKMALTERARFLVEALDLEAATDIPGAEWEPFQIAHLNDDGLLRHERKSRQVGWSWLIAAEAVANSMLYPRTTALFVSINREESAEKIRYADLIYNALYPQFRVPMTQDAITMKAYGNGSRILSMPQRPVRGKPKAWLYLDEFAHYRLDREIYTAGVPVTTKGGKVRIGSSTLGARGVFWEIGEQRVRSYPGYTRATTPWWSVGSLLKEEYRDRLGEVSRICRNMGEGNDAITQQVERFANQRIRDIFANLPIDDFAQEYNCLYIDEAVAYIPWADIQACCIGDGTLDPFDIISNSTRRGGFGYDDRAYSYWIARTPDGAMDVVEEMANAVADGTIQGPLVWGLDVGRKKDLTELAIVELLGGQHICRAIISLDRQQFATQDLIIRRVLDTLPIVRGYMDATGLGMQLAETIHLRDGYGERALPATFSAPSKALWATHLKTRFQRGATRATRGGILIPNDRDLKYQIHSIRRKVTANSNIVFDVEHTERHHADKFWALALANEAGETLERIAAYPVADTTTLRTTHRLESHSPPAREPELGDTYGFGLTREQFDQLIEQGAQAFLAVPLTSLRNTPVIPPAASVAITEIATDAPTSSDDDTATATTTATTTNIKDPTDAQAQR